MISSAVNQAAARSLLGLQQSTSNVALSTARLSAGRRLINASDDVAALSIATRLNSQLTTLRQAQENTRIGDAMMQIASGGVSQITDIVSRMQALATQANSGALTNTERSFLNTEFQNLRAEIDRIAGNTNYNGINLLDGSLSESNFVTPARTEATAATGSLQFTGNVGAGQTIVLNGVTLTEGADFAAGGTVNDTLNNIANAINTSSNGALAEVSAGVVGTTLNLTAKAGGAAGNQFTINEGASTANAVFNTVGGTTNQANVFTLQGGTNDGVFGGSTTGTGVVGDSLLTAQNQSSASVTLSVTSIANNNLLRIDDGNGGTIDFRFRTTPTAAETDIQIGADVEETLQNAVDVIERYRANNTNNDTYGLNQLEFRRDGNNLVISSSGVGNPTDLNGNVLDINETITGGTLSATTFNNGSSTGGVDASGVTEDAFVGTISGFSATYNSANNITAQVTVGDTTYEATITNTNPGANTTVRFNATSGDGGYFDVQLSGGNGQAVLGQADADAFASRLDAAFSGLSFSQNRPITDFSGVGDLAGASLELQGSDFSTVNIDSVNVSAPTFTGGDAIIEVTINGDVYRSSSNIGDSIGANEVIEFTNITNGNEVLTLRNGNNSIDLSTSTAAADFESDFETSLGVTGDGTAEFRIGTSTNDVIEFDIGDLSSDRLFNGESINIATQGAAASVNSILDNALNILGAANASIGSAQSRLEYAESALSDQIIQTDLARSVLEDTDIAEESTQLALGTVQTQAAIAALLQTRTLANSYSDLLSNN